MLARGGRDRCDGSRSGGASPNLHLLPVPVCIECYCEYSVSPFVEHLLLVKFWDWENFRCIDKEYQFAGHGVLDFSPMYRRSVGGMNYFGVGETTILHWVFEATSKRIKIYSMQGRDAVVLYILLLSIIRHSFNTSN